MSETTLDIFIHQLNGLIEPFPDATDKYSNLLKRIGSARFVLIGEASHGTHEFYQTRIEITQQLIEKNNANAVAIEGDWPDVYLMDRYVKGFIDTPADALQAFKRFPTWMWRNATIPPFLTWLRTFNDRLSPAQKVGLYGLDLYSLDTSMQAVINYLTKIDPEAARAAQKRYECFDHLQVNPQDYGYLTSSGIKKSCMDEAIQQLLDIQKHKFDYIQKNGLEAEEEYFYATQNARLVKNAERYYRSMFEGHNVSWNLRDQHMSETFSVLDDHLTKRLAASAKIVVWAHNSHLGDARATEMASKGEFNVGQLIREKYGADCYAIGFSTFDGTVTASSDWGSAPEPKKINPGLKGSWEEIFHQLKYKNFILPLHECKKLDPYLSLPRLQRAIGVIYKPETERLSHYFFTRLPYQFDSIIHFDKTSAVEPLN